MTGLELFLDLLVAILGAGWFLDHEAMLEEKDLLEKTVKGLESSLDLQRRAAAAGFKEAREGSSRFFGDKKGG